MKKLTLIISILISFFSAQGQKDTKFNLDPISSSYYSSQEVNTPGINENELYTRANKWFANNLLTEGIQLWNDNVTGKLIGNGKFELSGYDVIDNENSNSNFVFTFTITVLMKDYKYKYTISNYKYSLSIDNTVVLIGDYLLNTSCPVCDARAWSIIKKHVHTQTQNMITSLNESLVKTSEPVLSVN